MNKIEEDFLHESEIIINEVLRRKLHKIEKENITSSLTDILHNFTSTIINKNYYLPCNNASYFCQQPNPLMLPYENDYSITFNKVKKNRQHIINIIFKQHQRIQQLQIINQSKYLFENMKKTLLKKETQQLSKQILMTIKKNGKY